MSDIPIIILHPDITIEMIEATAQKIQEGCVFTPHGVVVRDFLIERGFLTPDGDYDSEYYAFKEAIKKEPK